MCVFGSHGNSTTYQRPQNRAGAAGTARVLPKNNPCQRWHEWRKSEAGGDNMTHTCEKIHTHARGRTVTHARAHTDMYACRHTSILLSPLIFPLLPFKIRAHTLDILPFFLAGASHGNSSRNPFSTDAGTAVLILNETQLVLPLLHAARDKNYMLLNSNLYCLLPKCIQFIPSLSLPPSRALNSTPNCRKFTSSADTWWPPVTGWQ